MVKIFKLDQVYVIAEKHEQLKHSRRACRAKVPKAEMDI